MSPKVTRPQINHITRVEAKEESKVLAKAKKRIAKKELSDDSSSGSMELLRKKNTVKKPSSEYVLEKDVTVQKMASKKFEGWRIKLDGESCGFVKFYPKVDEVFKNHVTVDFCVPKPQRGRHIGRFALKKAIDSSAYPLFVSHLRKSNLASQRALVAVGFIQHKYPDNNQLCMVFRKISS